MAWNYPDGCGPDDYEKWFGPDTEERASEILCPWDNRSPPNGCIQ